MAMFGKPTRVVLALGGGGARGLAHIGVLRAIEASRVTPSAIVGTSMGSIIGTLIALGMDSHQIEQEIKNFIDSPSFKRSGLARLQRREPVTALGLIGQKIKNRLLLNMSLSRQSIFDLRRLQIAVDGLLPDIGFNDLRYPLAIVATDIMTGMRIVFTEGSVREAVMASSSIPGIFPPVPHGHTFLTDGGVTDMVPSRVALDWKGKPVLAVDVSMDLEPYTGKENMFELIQRTGTITSQEMTAYQMDAAQITIRPDVGHYPWHDFHQIDNFIRAGETAASSVLQGYPTGLIQRILDRFKKP